MDSGCTANRSFGSTRCTASPRKVNSLLMNSLHCFHSSYQTSELILSGLGKPKQCCSRPSSSVVMASCRLTSLLLNVMMSVSDISAVLKCVCVCERVYVPPPPHSLQSLSMTPPSLEVQASTSKPLRWGVDGPC